MIVVSCCYKNLNEESYNDEDSLDPALSGVVYHTGDDTEESAESDEEEDSIIGSILDRVPVGWTLWARLQVLCKTVEIKSIQVSFYRSHDLVKLKLQLRIIIVSYRISRRRRSALSPIIPDY